MKKNLLLLGFSFTVTSVFSQNYCGSARYDTEIFPTVITSSNVSYGQNIDINGNNQILIMDVYEPSGDVAPKRPLIIFAHGGGFVLGSKTDQYAIDYCTAFAKRGYVAVSIDYRMGMAWPATAKDFESATWRAMQDMKSAIRFFRKDASTNNIYRIDPNYIFAGGASAGGFMVVQLAYLDKPSEVPSAIDTNLLGGLEGSSGNSGYSSSVNAIVNLCGAIFDTTWMQPGDIPMVSAQGGADELVPYDTHMMSDPLGLPIMTVSGTCTMHIRAYHIGLTNPYHTYYGQHHTSPGSPQANLDTTIFISSDFLYQQLGCTPSSSVSYTNQPTCAGSPPPPPPPPPTSTQEFILSEENINVFPNPSSGEFEVRSSEFKVEKVEVYDIMGKIVEQKTLNSKLGTLNLNAAKGVYSVKIYSGENYLVKKIVIE
ncbi:MAG: T9SS type A sorting domain-containing protein [Bacteroidetes bacterium]|nr:T9SS type A sorting domain-containing protein [Bacteroidota bacterium]